MINEDGTSVYSPPRFMDGHYQRHHLIEMASALNNGEDRLTLVMRFEARRVI